MSRGAKIVLIAVFVACRVFPAGGEHYGELIFEDRFERTESQERKDEPGNEWTTSSDKTAAGHKQVDLRDGVLYVYTHKDANHATSVRQAFSFIDGTVGLRFKLPEKGDSLLLNFADPGLKSVHAGHLFKVLITPEGVRITDQKTGEMNLVIRNAKKAGSLTDSQREVLASTAKYFPFPVSVGEWHQVLVTVKDDAVTCQVDGTLVGTFRSDGFAHRTKTLLRLLVARNAYVDDVRIWQAK